MTSERGGCGGGAATGGVTLAAYAEEGERQVRANDKSWLA